MVPFWNPLKCKRTVYLVYVNVLVVSRRWRAVFGLAKLSVAFAAGYIGKRQIRLLTTSWASKAFSTMTRLLLMSKMLTISAKGFHAILN